MASACCPWCPTHECCHPDQRRPVVRARCSSSGCHWSVDCGLARTTLAPGLLSCCRSVALSCHCSRGQHDWRTDCGGSSQPPPPPSHPSWPPSAPPPGAPPCQGEPGASCQTTVQACLPCWGWDRWPATPWTGRSPSHCSCSATWSVVSCVTSLSVVTIYQHYLLSQQSISWYQVCGLGASLDKKAPTLTLSTPYTDSDYCLLPRTRYCLTPSTLHASAFNASEQFCWAQIRIKIA